MKVKSLFLAMIMFISFGQMMAQEDFSVTIEEMTINNMPGLHSMVVAHWGGEWLLLGGRIDGLHQRQPFAAFLAADNNTLAYVVDPASGQVWSTSLAILPTGIFEQLQSTNMEFETLDSMLYITGGYGFSTTANDHITYPNLTAVNLPGLINAIKANTVITPYFRQITDNNLQVTGGYLDYMNGTFFLVGGQDFEGRYNPMGPTHGPGFFQEYSDEIRMFEIQDNGTSLSITNYVAVRDTANLHRRDYNMTPQIFPNGDRGFTAWTGVFQPITDLPWLNTVDIKAGGSYTVNNTFNQYLSQYHSAQMPVYDSLGNAMHTIFFGGMSQYTMDTSNNTLVEDQDVPFVKTISRVSRWANGNMDEYRLPVDMPGLLGSGAEFLVKDGVASDVYEIIKLNDLPMGKSQVGYIVGGIESTAANIFFINNGTQSDASSRIFKVYITRGATAIDSELANEALEMQVFPNPSTGKFAIDLNSHFRGEATIEMIDAQGRVVDSLFKGNLQNGKYHFQWDGSLFARGIYFVKVSAGNFVGTEKVLLH